MSARDRLEAAQVRLRAERELLGSDECEEADQERALFERATFEAWCEIERCRERWRQWNGVREGRPLHPFAWLAGPVLTVALIVRFGLPLNAVIGWAIAGLLSVEAWCWVRANLRTARLQAEVWPRPGEYEPDAPPPLIPRR